MTMLMPGFQPTSAINTPLEQASWHMDLAKGKTVLAFDVVFRRCLKLTTDVMLLARPTSVKLIRDIAEWQLKLPMLGQIIQKSKSTTNIFIGM